MAHGDRLRIVHCVRAPIGGIFRHIADLAREQAKAGHAVGLICDSLTIGPFEAEKIDQLRPYLELGAQSLPMRREIRISDLGASLSVFRRIRSLKPDVLHAHGSKGGAYVRVMGTALRLFGQRPLRFYCPHGGSLHYEADTRKGRIIFGLEHFLERLTDGLIFVSAYERDQYALKVGTPTVPSKVVYNGLAPAEFKPVEPGPTRRDFLFIGMLRDIKGPDVFIRAMKLLNEGGAPATAHIVGDGPDSEAYQALVQEVGLGERISFHASMPARNAFAMADNIVVPSRGESMPYIVLEAIAAEMPIIATDVGGIPEIFASETDRLIEPGDPQALARAMAGHLADPETYRANARERAARIADTFSLAHMAEAIEDAYRSIRPPIKPTRTPQRHGADTHGANHQRTLRRLAEPARLQREAHHE
ncbi:MAG: glycosyltransferase [Pseudomonadota bacterium]